MDIKLGTTLGPVGMYGSFIRCSAIIKYYRWFFAAKNYSSKITLISSVLCSKITYFQLLFSTKK
jgi:hypothetical protein